MTFEPLLEGMALFMTMATLWAAVFGTAFGLIIGVLPGLGPLMGIILFLPVAFHMDPLPGMALLISIYVGGSAGGAIPAILIRIPGTPLAAATLLDGYPMKERGMAKKAVGMALAASAIGGILGGLLLVFCAPLLADVALNFAPPEYFAMTLTGLLVIAFVSPDSTIKALMTGILGLILSTVGYDQFANVERFTFGVDGLLGGISIVPVVVGIFAISEVIAQVREGNLTARPNVPIVWPSLSAVGDTIRHWKTLLRSSLLGASIGALPGTGGGVAAFTAYAVEKGLSRHPERFGTGEEAGVVATESANNATVGGTLIPTLALGIPGDASSAVLMGALIILGFFPGPSLFEQHQDVVGGIFLAYILSNFLLLFIGILLAPVFVAFIKLKKQFLLPVILVLCVLGVFSLQSSVFDLWVMLGAGLVGYLFRVFSYPLPPLVIGLVLGPICESEFRRSLILSREHYGIFFERPISAAILSLNIALLIWIIIPKTIKQEMFRRLKNLQGVVRGN